VGLAKLLLNAMFIASDAPETAARLVRLLAA
jgi:hypothetical protein